MYKEEPGSMSVKNGKLKNISANSNYPYPDDYDPLNPENYLDLPDPEDVMKETELRKLIEQQTKEKELDDIGICYHEHKDMSGFDLDTIDGKIVAQMIGDLMDDEMEIDRDNPLIQKIFFAVCKKAKLTEKQISSLYWHEFYRMPVLWRSRKKGDNERLKDEELMATWSKTLGTKIEKPVDESTIREHISAGRKKILKYIENFRLKHPLNTPESD